MPKFKKEKKGSKIPNKKAFDENFAYSTVIKSVILAGVFFIISILFNTEIIKLFTSQSGFLFIFEIIIKIFSILLFFFFMIISIGNYKELTGKPLNLKLIILIFLLSLLQAYKNPIVFTFTFFGLLAITIYIFIVQ